MDHGPVEWEGLQNSRIQKLVSFVYRIFSLPLLRAKFSQNLWGRLWFQSHLDTLLCPRLSMTILFNDLFVIYRRCRLINVGYALWVASLIIRSLAQKYNH